MEFLVKGIIILTALLFYNVWIVLGAVTPSTFDFVNETFVMIPILIVLYYSIIVYKVNFFLLIIMVLYVLLIISDYAVCYKHLGIDSSAGQITHDGFIALYFSTMTITTVGYGDFVPANNWARAYAASEALLGYFLLALLIAKITQLFRENQ